MSWFDDTINEAWDWIDRKLTALWNDFGPALTTFATSVMKHGGLTLVAAAGAAALSAEVSGAKGLDKLKIAADMVLKDMGEKMPGIVLTDAVNAVQIAVTNMQNGLDATGKALPDGAAPLLPPAGASDAPQNP